MKNRKTYLLRGLLVLLAAALVLAAALPGLGLSTGGPTPLPQAQADPLRPEGQSQSPQTPPDQPEEPDTPQEPDTPEEPQEPGGIFAQLGGRGEKGLAQGFRMDGQGGLDPLAQAVGLGAAA